AGALDLGRGSIAGTLVARSGVHIGQSGALLVGGTALLDAGSGSIELSNANNDFDGPVTASGASIVMFDRDDLSIASLDILGGLVRLDAGGTLTLQIGRAHV